MLQNNLFIFNLSRMGYQETVVFCGWKRSLFLFILSLIACMALDMYMFLFYSFSFIVCVTPIINYPLLQIKLPSLVIFVGNL